MTTSKITDNTLLGLGFSLGATGVTWRIDGWYENDWYYIQAYQVSEDLVELRTYGSTNGTEHWELLDQSSVSTAQDLEAYLNDMIGYKLPKSESLVRPIRRIAFMIKGSRTYITL